MRIQIFSDTSAWGGTEAHALALASVLAQRHHDVAIVCFGRDVFSERLGSPAVRVLHVCRNWLRLPQNVHGDLCVLEKGAVEVGSCRIELAARMRFERLMTIEQLCADAMPPRSLGSRLGFWRYRAIARRWVRSLAAQRIICVSDAVKDRLVRDYHFPPHKMLTIHNGIDPQRFLPSEEFRRKTREAWGIPRDALVFGAVGRLSAVKGFDLAIRAFAAATLERDARLVLVGDGPDRAMLQQLSRDLGQRVIFPGFTDKPQQAYPAIDVFLMPSHNEGLPHALLEAMACECCPVAMAAPGIAEVIADANLGWLVSAGDERGFIDAMQTAAACSPQELHDRGERGRQRVMTHFNSHTQLAAIADVIEGQSVQAPASLAPLREPLVRKVSVAIATYNRADDLRATLRSLAQIDISAVDDYEVLIVDNNSTDATALVAKELASLFAGHLRYVKEARQGLSHARNRAVVESRFDIIAFLDDDVDLDKAWLAGLMDAYASGDWAAIGGKAYLVFPAARPRWLGARNEGYLTRVDRGPRRREVLPEQVYGVNLSFRREWLVRIGGFRLDMGRIGTCLLSGEDTDALERVAAAGGRIGYEPAAIVGHRVPHRRLRRRWFYARGFWGTRSVPRNLPRSETASGLMRTGFYLARASWWATWALLTAGGSSEEFFHYSLRVVSLIGRTIGYIECCFAKPQVPHEPLTALTQSPVQPAAS